MNLLKISKTDRKWWEIILWWEIRRIPYNVIMYFIGLFLNIMYTLGWVIELLYINRQKSEIRKFKYPKYTFMIYLAVSVLFVFGIALFLLLR